MTTYLLTWNPAKYRWDTLQEDIRELRAQGLSRIRWSCGSTRRIRSGDRVFLMRLGREPRGIIASGTVHSEEPFEDEHWDPHSASFQALYVHVDFDALLDVDTDPEAILGWDTLREEVPQPHDWTPQASGISIPSQVATRLEQLWSQLLAVQPHTCPDADGSFVKGRTYRRRDIHDTYGGQWQGGISTPADENIIFLFTGETGEAYGYRDRWTDEGLFLYTGEGQEGDMTFVRGNRAVRDHTADGKDLYLFEYARQGHVRYIGQVVCTGYHERQGPDRRGQQRRIIVFELSPIDSFIFEAESHTTIQPTQSEALATLRERAFGASTYAATPRQRLAQAYCRSRDVRVYVLARADGTCEACGRPAPFTTTAGRPYLETHHIRRLSDAGPDDPRWVIALCPNCHRQAHYAYDKADFKKRATEIVHKKELRLADQ